MKHLKKLLTLGSLTAVLALASAGFMSVPAMAAPVDVIQESCNEDGSNSALCDDAGKSLTGKDSIFKTITDIFLFIIGAVAVIMIVVGGFKYVLSGGDQAQITSAKNTIMYSIVGLVVAFLPYAMVDFVVSVI